MTEIAMHPQEAAQLLPAVGLGFAEWTAQCIDGWSAPERCGRPEPVPGRTLTEDASG